jgi:hypothetical protein
MAQLPFRLKSTHGGYMKVRVRDAALAYRYIRLLCHEIANIL